MKPIVQITWIDACSAHGWRNEPTAPTANHTIGFLVHTDDDFMEVACTYDPEGGFWNGSISIPQDNIVTYRVIHEGAQEDMEIIFEAE